ncbi:MAG: hypothetical protein M3O31_06100 [Acidobacteriota bacterium]|nr:hypothetical protein [Acidobacteriota bacterium]
MFSASLKENSRFLRFWRLREVSPVTSRYSIEEITRNLKTAGHELRLANLLTLTEIVSDADIRLIPSYIKIAAKDAPILATSIGASVDYLVTGDTKHFAHLYGKTVSGVHILTSADFIDLHEDRLGE